MDIAAQPKANGARANGKAAAAAILPAHIRQLRRAFTRQLALKGRPNAFLASLLRQAAMATAIAELAMGDATVDHNSRVRLATMARKCRNELAAAATVARNAEPQPTLAELLGG